MDIQSIHHVAILTDDYERSKFFYTEILGFKVIKETFRKERNSFKLDLSLNGLYQIELFSFPETKPRASFPEQRGLRHLAFGVNNIEKAREELILKSIDVEAIRIDEITNKKFCFFKDPNDQPLELYEI
ncbi:MAG: VOC family protein [Chitinophagia bacterium]|jgi:glyoxylase I family protein|nr:VOC family protein [Chitinophagia bacterium]